MADSIKQVIIQLVSKHGDQTSIEFIMKKAEKKIEELLNKITEEQVQIIDSTNLSVEKFMGEINDHRKFRVEKMAVAVLMGRFARFSSYESVVRTGSKLYNLIATIRWMWRVQNKITRDCRKYKGGQ